MTESNAVALDCVRKKSSAEFRAKTTATLARNTAHVAKLLSGHNYPGQ
ncbi:hypothetical protein [Nocardia sp. NPDC059228]